MIATAGPSVAAAMLSGMLDHAVAGPEDNGLFSFEIHGQLANRTWINSCLHSFATTGLQRLPCMVTRQFGLVSPARLHSTSKLMLEACRNRPLA